MPLKKINSEDLAKWIVQEVKSVNHLKLQKLLYLCEAWHLGYFEHSLIDDEFEAWVHGPVTKKIWIQFKDKSNLYNEISKPKESDMLKELEGLNQEQKELIGEVLGEYGDKSSYYLEALTHDDAPWIEARRGKAIDEKSNQVIDKALLKKTYSEKYQSV